MNIPAIVFALVAALFTVAAFADHNRTDQQGRKQGHWTEFPEQEDLLAREGNYVDDIRHGRWVLQFADGQVEEGPFVAGKRHGKWTIRFADGNVGKGPFVVGKRHGQWISRGVGGSVLETPYKNGKKHGMQVYRMGANGPVVETPYKDGKEHGKEIWRFADGNVSETCWENGNKVDC